MDSVFINYIILLVSVVFVSLLQTRLKIFTENPILFFLTLILVPLMILGKMNKIHDWDDAMYFIIAGYTLMLAYGFNKYLVPKINEGFVLAYTLIFWYIETTSICEVGINFWSVIIPLISIFPTYLIVKESFEDRILELWEKRVLIIWFYFMIVYIYIDQIVLSKTICPVHFEDVGVLNTFFIFMIAVKLYFISCLGSLLLISIPIFHLDRSSRKFKVRWAEAMNDWRDYMNNAVHNYIDYQITPVQAIYIIMFSLFLFFLDLIVGFRIGLIEIYITIIPILIFYIKLDITQIDEI